MLKQKLVKNNETIKIINAFKLISKLKERLKNENTK